MDTSRADGLFQAVTNDIIRRIEAGANGSQWQMPWETLGMAPTSLSTGKPYRGINWLILSFMAIDRGYKSTTWATYNRWMDEGEVTTTVVRGRERKSSTVHVRKDEKATEIFLWKTVKPSKRQLAENPDAKPFLLPRTFYVFNRDQVEGLAPEVVIERPEHERWAEADAYFAAIDADVREGGARAYYAPVQDYIAIPHLADFKKRDWYYTTRAHETAHWSGHSSRLNRDLSGRFGDRKYAAEELVAELSAAFWGAQMGLEPAIRQDHAEYVGSWVQALRDDPRAIMTAASKAQQAVDYMNRQAGFMTEVECEVAA